MKKYLLELLNYIKVAAIQIVIIIAELTIFLYSGMILDYKMFVIFVLAYFLIPPALNVAFKKVKEIVSEKNQKR